MKMLARWWHCIKSLVFTKVYYNSSGGYTFYDNPSNKSWDIYTSKSVYSGAKFDILCFYCIDLDFWKTIHHVRGAMPNLWSTLLKSKMTKGRGKSHHHLSHQSTGHHECQNTKTKFCGNPSNVLQSNLGTHQLSSEDDLASWGKSRSFWAFGIASKYLENRYPGQDFLHSSISNTQEWRRQTSANLHKQTVGTKACSNMTGQYSSDYK